MIYTQKNTLSGSNKELNIKLLKYPDLELWHSGEYKHADGGQDEEGAHYDQHLQE